jgi:porphobilinogen synthase
MSEPSTFSLQLSRRPRRLRRTAAIRALCEETSVPVHALIQPVFVKEGDGADEPIESMPGILRRNCQRLVEHVKELHQLGIKGIALFPQLPADKKTPHAREALNPKTLVLEAIRALKQSVPDITLFADIALDPYTSHGHDGLLDSNGNIINDATVEILMEMAVLHAEAGVDFVAPSDMMDGRIGAIRMALDDAGFAETGILAYAAKFASAYYGPFRDAVGSAQAAGTHALDKRGYQLSPGNRREALLECLLDQEEGADILMVKPAGPYLDILRDARETVNLPLAAYQVSGEYAQIQAAAQKGWLDLDQVRDESLIAIRRAGADMILTYFAEAIARERASGKSH